MLSCHLPGEVDGDGMDGEGMYLGWEGGRSLWAGFSPVVMLILLVDSWVCPSLKHMIDTPKVKIRLSLRITNSSAKSGTL